MSTVAHILSAKGRDTVTTQPHRTVAEAARLLDERKIGAVLVTSADGGLLGILSERDIVRAVARSGPAVLDDSVSRHMTGKVVTTRPDCTVTSVMEAMTAGRFRHMPVLEGGRIVGVISIGDAVKHRIEQIESEHSALREYIATA
jgi:CBS domain-containing protein